MKRLLTAAAILITVTSIARAQDIAGDWQGTLNTGMGEMRLVLHITKAVDGGLKGSMDSPDQGSVGAPLDTLTFEGMKLHFTLNVAKGVFDGSMKGNGSLSGNWIQGTPPTKFPITFNRQTTPIKIQHDPAPPSDIDGTWDGIFETPSGKVHVTFHIKNTADGLTATMDSQDMNIASWPATGVNRKGSSLKIFMKQVNVVFQGKLNKALDAMSGDWTQGDDPSRAMNLKRQKEAAPAPQKQ